MITRKPANTNNMILRAIENFLEALKVKNFQKKVEIESRPTRLRSEYSTCFLEVFDFESLEKIFYSNWGHVLGM